MAIRLYNKANNGLIGTLSDADFQFLVDYLEEESETDDDYFIDLNTVEDLEAAGASATLIAVLRPAAGEEGIDIRWEKD